MSKTDKTESHPKMDSHQALRTLSGEETANQIDAMGLDWSKLAQVFQSFLKALPLLISIFANSGQGGVASEPEKVGSKKE